MIPNMGKPGAPVTVAPDIRRVLAPNPSPMTGPGTNTYIIGQGNVAVIDPGPDSPAHLAAILGALGPGETVSHILITHAHLDHSALAARLRAKTGATVVAYGDATAGRSEIMKQLVADALGGGEGTDHDFRPDLTLADGAWLNLDSWQVQALWTPGHFGSHLCFDFRGTVFTGDLVMEWSSSLISPPDGDLTDYMRSLRRLSDHPARQFLPGHGQPCAAPKVRLDQLITHREARETEIRKALRDGPATASDLAARIYADQPKAVLPAAARNVLAHLVDLTERRLAEPVDILSAETEFRLSKAEFL